MSFYIKLVPNIRGKGLWASSRAFSLFWSHALPCSMVTCAGSGRGAAAGCSGVGLGRSPGLRAGAPEGTAPAPHPRRGGGLPLGEASRCCLGHLGQIHPPWGCRASGNTGGTAPSRGRSPVRVLAWQSGQGDACVAALGMCFQQLFV